ncbi:MAG TPA: hypothetical protein VKA34_23845 [Balneolales bacterium]|nr:hypothetical protein [Balneolales bacterium]
MKLVALMCIAEYSKDLKKILVKVNVPVFSEIDIDGFRMDTDKSIEENWFTATKMASIYSSLYFAFVNEAKAENLFKAVEEYNKQQNGDNLHPLRAFLLNVEKQL